MRTGATLRDEAKLVKVAVDGVPYLHKVDLAAHNGYAVLLRTLRGMFASCLGAGATGRLVDASCARPSMWLQPPSPLRAPPFRAWVAATATPPHSSSRRTHVVTAAGRAHPYALPSAPPPARPLLRGWGPR